MGADEDDAPFLPSSPVSSGRSAGSVGARAGGAGAQGSSIKRGGPKKEPPGAASETVVSPCPALGAGWTQKVVPRGKTQTATADKYFVSPEGQTFRSMVAVRRYLVLKAEAEGRADRAASAEGKRGDAGTAAAGAGEAAAP